MVAGRDSLLLWDIDGTLVDTDRAGERALLRSIAALYGHDLADLPLDLRGRTDTSILVDLLGHLKQDAGPAEAARFQAAYLANLAQTLPQGHGRLHPGIAAALAAVHEHPEIHQALLTGNLEAGAKLKLSHLGIWRYFEFGAFADDSSDRNQLGPFALRRAKEKLGIDFPPERVYVIGDTPRDVACGRAFGARTIAVATGTYSVAELQATAPDYCLPNLADTGALLKIVLG